MSRARPHSYRASAWLIGFVVLFALGVAATWMIQSGQRREGGGKAPVVEDRPVTTVEPVPALLNMVGEQAKVTVAVVRGVVSLPDGRPAPGATVTLHRVVTAWPEWRTEPADEAITDESGSFQFRVPHLYGYLVEFAHAPHAGGLREVPPFEQRMELQLRPGYSIVGNVLNDVGAPVPNARVAIEAVPRDNRRARVAYTAADGSYRFDHLAAGPARMVARHESWQPVAAAAIVIGDRLDAEFRFERPTMSPLRGVVLCATTQEPIEGATIELVPIQQSLGLVDPIAATSEADGTFLLEGLPRGSMRMLVRHPDYGAVKRTQVIGAVSYDLTIDMPRRTLVKGQLDARGDRAFAGGEVLELLDEGGQLAWATVDDQGRFAFDRPVSPGFVDISTVGRAFSFRTLTGTMVSTRLSEAPENVVEIPVLPAPVLRGRFVDDDGAPIAGVSVARTQQLGENMRHLSDAAMSLDLGKVGGRILRLTDRDEPLAFSGEDGRFEVRGFKPGRLLARASCAGRGSRWLRVLMPPYGEVHEAGDIVLGPGCSISGRVLRGGQPFVGATVTVSSPICDSQATTDARGYYSIVDLVPGQYTVRARIIGRPARSDARVVTTRPGRPARNVDITLEAGRLVRGVVRNEQGAPLADVLVSVRGRPGEVSRSRANGAFSVELPRRRSELLVSVGDRSLQKVVTVGRDQELVEVQLDAPPTCSIVGLVLGAPGRRRLPGVLMRVTPLGAGRTGAEPVTRWVPTPDGELRRSGVPSGHVRIELWCDGYAPSFFDGELVANEDNQLGEIVLERGSRLRGRVIDANGNPVRGARVLLGEESDFDLFEPSVISGEDGTFAIQGVTSRSRQLVVRHPAFAARTQLLELPRDVLSLERLPVTLERGCTIEVVVPRDAIPDDGLVFLRRDGRLLSSTVLDERGKAWFANRSAGEYSVKVAGSDLEERRVVVAPGAEVTQLMFE
ncbi:MAG: carboxypeptidase regulatory-like domain-containing protein [Planctomycetes bacterium]|nr:carboxypeptidase regulatory-like domain-containing protein [Planctomycetota bacterium]